MSDQLADTLPPATTQVPVPMDTSDEAVAAAAAELNSHETAPAHPSSSSGASARVRVRTKPASTGASLAAIQAARNKRMQRLRDVHTSAIKKISSPLARETFRDIFNAYSLSMSVSEMISGNQSLRERVATVLSNEEPLSNAVGETMPAKQACAFGMLSVHLQEWESSDNPLFSIVSSVLLEVAESSAAAAPSSSSSSSLAPATGNSSDAPAPAQA